MNRRHALGLLAAAPLIPGAARAQTPAGGRLVEHPALASTHAQPRDVIVWLPPGYDDQPDRRWPVLYMHDGQNLFDPARAPFGEWCVDEHLTRLDPTGQIRTPIVVGVHNTPLRLREYVPAGLIAALPADMRDEVQAIYGGPPLSQGYLRFLVEELKPLIDGAYRTLTGPQDTAIMGSSMGGLISLDALSHHPSVFGSAGCVSTHWPLKVDSLGDDPATIAAWRGRLVAAWTGVIRDGLPPPGNHRLYFDRGDETTDAFYAEFQSAVDTTIRDLGWPADRFRSLVFPGAQHNEASWNQRLDVPLTFLFPPAQS